MGANFTNKNQCRLWNQTISTALTRLSGADEHGVVASEVFIVNNTGGALSIYAHGNIAAGDALIIDDTQSVTIYGITDTAGVSATAASAGSISCQGKQYSEAVLAFG
tara:strand:- start:5119 stop:5439 length:321 start_codon:yes stop_codon:yes gene_type:complete